MYKIAKKSDSIVRMDVAMGFIAALVAAAFARVAAIVAAAHDGRAAFGAAPFDWGVDVLFAAPSQASKTKQKGSIQ